MPRPAHPSPTGPAGPFVGYCVTLAPQANHQCLAELAATHTGLRPLLGQSRATSIALPTTAATALYDAAEATAREHTAPFPLHFTPIRRVRGRALRFEAVALGPDELLSLVHDGFFGPARGRQAAIAAVAACGALPVPGLGLPPLQRRVPPAAAEHHVDTLIEREWELHLGRGGSPA